MRMRAERSGRDGLGPSLRGASSATRGRSNFNDREGGRAMVMDNQVRIPSDFRFFLCYRRCLKC